MIDAAELRKLCLSFPGIGRDLPLRRESDS